MGTIGCVCYLPLKKIKKEPTEGKGQGKEESTLKSHLEQIQMIHSETKFP